MDDMTSERLRRVLKYDPESGVFTRLEATSNKVRVGAAAGGNRKDGYRLIAVDGRRFYAHRLAFLWVTGAWPASHVDHMNGDKSDNRWSNLRDAGVDINAQNLRAAQSNSRSGHLGVSPNGHGWAAQITVKRKCQHLGTFATQEAARAAYVEAKRRLHAGCTI